MLARDFVYLKQQNQTMDQSAGLNWLANGPFTAANRSILFNPRNNSLVGGDLSSSQPNGAFLESVLGMLQQYHTTSVMPAPAGDAAWPHNGISNSGRGAELLNSHLSAHSSPHGYPSLDATLSVPSPARGTSDPSSSTAETRVHRNENHSSNSRQS